MYNRLLSLELSSEETCFLWGPRQSGKSTFLKALFPGAMYCDLLLTEEYHRFVRNPESLRQECEAKSLTGESQKAPIIVDEVQKVPELMDEIHWLIENRGLRFVLCGSSARKLKRKHGNLLGGRAVRYEMLPLVFAEIPDFDLGRALNNGLLPRHYQSNHAYKLLEAYVGDYLKEEIAAEAQSRNLASFSRFLDSAALTNGEIVKFRNVASDCGVSAPTAKGYFQILEDTLIGRMLPAFRGRAKRRIIGAPKFFFADLGIVNFLARRGKIESRSELFGRAFEHFIFQELTACSSYSRYPFPIRYWRTASGFEVDFILNDGEIAVEVKATSFAKNMHLKSLRAFREEYPVKRLCLISLDPASRKTDDGIDILPWRNFLEELWGGNFFD